MKTYKVTGMNCSSCERSVVEAIKKQLGEDTAIEASARTGEVRVASSADPQMVVFAIDGAGYSVDEINE